MKIRALSVCLAVVFAIVLFVPSINATWSEEGIELSTEPVTQGEQQVISDGSGGTIVVWYDDRNGLGNYDIFAQRFDRDGNILWDPAGVDISQLSSDQTKPVLVTDGAGGAIIAYLSNRTGDNNVLAQRIRSNGTLAWPVGGLTICGANNDQYSHCIVSDGNGGAIVAWTDPRTVVTNLEIYAAKIDSTGAMPWTYNGVPVCQAADNQSSPRITSDGSLGAIIAWIDQRNGDADIYIQKIGKNGNYSWTYNGEVVVNWSGTQSGHQIISDMLGGAIITWMDAYAIEYDILAQRINSDGTSAWSTGVSVCDYTDNQTYPEIVSDGAGGAIIAWTDHRNGNRDVYAHHIDYAGGSNWPTDGTPICVIAGEQQNTEIVTDGYGGAIILWDDNRFPQNIEIFGQRITSAGIVKWQNNGMNLSLHAGNQYGAKAIATGDGGVIATWRDYRNLTNTKIYAQIFDRFGYWGNPAAVITDASDVPADQGGQVLIEWSPIRMDEYPEELITHYTIWRSVSAPAAMAFMDEGTIVSSPCEVGLDFEGTAYRTDIVFGVAAAWEWVASVEAHYWEEYAYTCGTLHDFIEGVEDGMHYFVITANTADPFTFWDSAPDSAFSIDNLSPCAPLGLAGEQSYVPEGLQLSWEPNEEADLGGYNIYRGSDPTFEPDPGNLLATGCDPMAFDDGWSWDSGYCYKVAAVDIHGNESGYATLCMDQVTGDDPMPVPNTTFLAQNYPNPFNPSTSISFGLKDAGHVSLRIYDAAGRLVRELVEGERPAGHYTEHWDGVTAGGDMAASGVYFYRLTAKDFIETRKMILLR